tara:strand:- start:561 stop:845 length:285 start_codon:yes stop_codon:yes gene_type:complete
VISRRIPIPVSFIVVVAATIFLIIFLGAWAVSADMGDENRSLSFGFASSGASQDAGVADPSQPAGDGTPGQEEIGSSSEDKWWGKAFLTACPFH